MTVDPYLEPGTDVLRNRLGLRDSAQLAEAEAGLTLAAIQELGVRDVYGQYDLWHLRAFHREIFGDLYAWAGELRTVAIAKTDLFCLPQHIESYSAQVFDALAKERYLRDQSRDNFLDRLTFYFAEVNALHPFREGNGRTQRAFFRQLSRYAGWPIDWPGLDPVRNTEASAASLRGDNRPLRSMLDDLVRRDQDT